MTSINVSVKTRIIEYLNDQEDHKDNIGDIANELDIPKDTIRRTIKRSIDAGEEFFQYTPVSINRFRVVKLFDNDSTSLDTLILKLMIPEFIENDLSGNFTRKMIERITELYNEGED